jgi:hypothetical protein
MKKAFFIALFVSAIYGLAWAHPPSDISISYDPDTRMLQAVIIHNTITPPDTHYIKKVDVALNGKEIIEHQISRQDNNSSQTVYYLVPDARRGDTLSVEAYCNISGKLMKEIKIS